MVFPRLQSYRLFLVCMSVMAMYVFFKIQKGTKQTDTPNPHSRKTQLRKKTITKTIRQACVNPQLKENNSELMQFFHHVPAVKCSPEPDWIYTENGQMKVSTEAKETHGNISCVVSYLKRRDDFITDIDNTVNVINDTQLENDFFKIKCKGANGKAYDNIHSGIAYKSDHHKKKKIEAKSQSRGMGLDVLIIGFDSLSRLTFLRKLPKSYAYIVNTLEATVLHGYNIVGDGTPQALIPILTGKTELELPRTLKRIRGASYVDVYPMVWKNFSEHGYVTAWAEDQPNIGTFTYRMIGFKDQPVDHYARPFHIASMDERPKHKPLCFGSRRRTEVFLDWLKEFFIMYKDKSKFAFGFHNEVSHDDVNTAETADDDIVSLLSALKNGGYLSNTLLIVMSDHGARFSKLRETMQGKLEERMPFVSIAVPRWFYSKYPTAMNNLRTNAHRLSSPFDLYPTLLDMVDFKGDGYGDSNQRGISLFKKIPLTRTCKDASIESHWCACHKWIGENTLNPIVNTAADFIVSFLNTLVKPQNDKCATLSLNNITAALSLKAEEDFLHFKRTNDADGYAADLSDNTQIVDVLYQISLITTPGHGLFEATTKYNLVSKEFSIEESDISRINRYGDDPKCIHDTHEELRKYCYCK